MASVGGTLRPLDIRHCRYSANWNGVLLFMRQKLQDFPKWEKSAKGLTRLRVSPRGSIEDDGIKMLQVTYITLPAGGNTVLFYL